MAGGPTAGMVAWLAGTAAIAAATPADLPSLAAHTIGHYEPLHLNGAAILAQHDAHRRRRAMAAYTGATVPPLELDFDAHGRTFNTALRAAGSDLFTKEFAVEIISNEGRQVITDFDTSGFYHGHLRGEHDTAISAQIEGDVLVGMIHTPGEQYFIERADKYIANASFSNIIYKASDKVDSELHDDQHTCGEAYDGLHTRQGEWAAEQDTARRRRNHNAYNPAKNTCGVALIVDQRLMNAKFKSGSTFNTDGAIREVLRLLDGASLIYRSTSFTIGTTTAAGVAQFAAKRVLVYTADTGHPYAGAATCATSSQAGSCSASDECAQGYLDMLTGASPNSTIDAGWDDFCLAHAFTYRDFCGGILGLAWVGTPDGNANAGICAKRSGGRGSLNTGISTGVNFDQDVSTQVQVITLAHEFGHNFGANHDTSGLLSSSGAQCAPAGSLGNYIMYVKATDGDEENNDHFSECSKEAMAAVIEAHSADCFEAKESFTCGSTALVSGSCGNGILDVNEECECITGVSDPHCDCNTCQIVAGKECSALNDPVCCDSNGFLRGLNLSATIALYRDVLNSTGSTDINVLNTALESAFGTAGSTRCVEGTECTMSRFCIKDTRFVAYTGQDAAGSCPQIDFVANLADPTLQDPPANETLATAGVACYNFTEGCAQSDVSACSAEYKACDDLLASGGLNSSGGTASYCYLFHMTDQASCNNGNSLCRFNGCTGSLCGTYPRNDTQTGGATRCRITSDEAKSCHLACNFGTGGCVSTFDFNATFPHLSGIPGSHLSPGRACTVDGDEFGGRCNGNAQCVALSTPFANSLSPSAVSDWIQENWPLVLGLVLGGFLLAILLKVTYVKKKPQIKQAISKAEKTLRRRTGMPKTSSAPRTIGAADRPPLTSHMRHELRQKMKKEEALERMTAFFPKTPEPKVKAALKNSRNEEEAVKYLLKHNEPFAVPQSVPLIQ